MSNEEILEKLMEFGDYLSKGTVMQDIFRWVLWMLSKGLAWIVDSLENATDTILGLKLFYENEEFVSFVESFRPVLVILFALNLLFIGYLLIFQRKFNREAVFSNVIIALIVIVLLGSGMNKANRFTSDAIEAIGDTNSGGTVASSIIKDSIIDISMFDINNWETTNLENTNMINPDYVTDINIRSYLTEGSQITENTKLSDDGEDILSHKLETLGDGSRKVVELEDGNWITDITKEYYYRYTVDWFSILVTLGIMAFVLITISIKLAKLFFELAFNHLLATLVAPADMHSGQKTKQVIQNILSIFVVTIMIFLSMKVYMIGTNFLADNLEGVAYIIAMIGFAGAVIDGPNMVERLFGIDAGLKSGWGALAGTYALARGASSATKGLGNGLKNATKATGAVGNKAISGASGMAGLMGGLAGKQNQNNDQAKTNDNKMKNNDGQNENGMEKQQSNEGMEQQSQGQGETTGIENENNTNVGNGVSGGQSSLHAQMQAKEQQKNNNTSNKPRSLHDDMQKKGVYSPSTASAENSSASNGVGTVADSRNSTNASTPQGTEITNTAGTKGMNEAKQNGSKLNGISGNNQQQQTTQDTKNTGGITSTPMPSGNDTTGQIASSVQGTNSTSTVSNHNNQQQGQVVKDNHRIVNENKGKSNVGSVERQVTASQENRNSGSTGTSNVRTTGGTTSAPISSGSGSFDQSTTTEQTNNTTVVSNNNNTQHKQVIRESNHVVQEDRTVGQVIKERLSSNKTIQNTKRSYQIGRNTGRSIKRNFKRKG